MRHLNLGVAVLSILCATGFAGEKVGATQKRWDTERKEAEQEDQSELGLSFEQKARARYNYRGVFELQEGLDEGNPDVIGSFIAEDASGSRIFMLKLENKDLIRLLKNHDRKRVALYGKLRNSGKYLFVTAVADQSGGPTRSRRRAAGGL